MPCTPGSQLRVIGFHFERGKPYRILLDGAGAPLGTTVIDGAGHFDLTLAVPADFAPAGAEVALAVWSDFDPNQAVATQVLAALPPLGLSLSDSNALLGTTITATVTNLAAGSLQVHYGAVLVAGPLIVGAGTVAVPFVAPLSGGQAPGAPVTVQVQNVVAGLELGTAARSLPRARRARSILATSPTPLCRPSPSRPRPGAVTRRWR